MHLSMVCPRMGGGGGGQPMGIRLCKAHVGGDFDIHNGPQGGKFDSTTILDKLFVSGSGDGVVVIALTSHLHGPSLI